MLHSNIKVNFHNYEPLKVLMYEFNLYKNRKDELIRFVRAHYKQDYGEWSSEQFIQSYEKYQDMITEAIKNNDLDSLEVLW